MKMFTVERKAEELVWLRVTKVVILPFVAVLLRTTGLFTCLSFLLSLLSLHHFPFCLGWGSVELKGKI